MGGGGVPSSHESMGVFSHSRPWSLSKFTWGLKGRSTVSQGTVRPTLRMFDFGFRTAGGSCVRASLLTIHPGSDLLPTVCAWALHCVRIGLVVTSGSQFCQIDANGCATDGAGEHGNDEACTVQVNAVGTLTAIGFDVEPHSASEGQGCEWDYVDIGGTRYCNTIGRPYHVAVAAGSTFTWRSDHSGTFAGWTICFSKMCPCDPT